MEIRLHDRMLAYHAQRPGLDPQHNKTKVPSALVHIHKESQKYFFIQKERKLNRQIQEAELTD